MARPSPSSSSTPHTPSPASSRSHPPSSTRSHVEGAPVKASGGRGFSDHDGDVNSPSKSGEKVARRKGRAQRRSSAGKGSSEDEGALDDSPVRRMSVSLTFTPIRPVKVKESNSAPSSLAKQQQDFTSTMQTSNSKAQTYIAPHRRSVPPPITPASYSPNHLSYYDRSNLPPSEDRYYNSPPQGRTSAIASAFSSYDTSPAHTHPSRSTPGSWKYQSESPSPAPPAAIISRGPYEDPARHPHPPAITEEHESASVSSWADEVERQGQELSLDNHDDDEVEQPFYSPMPWPGAGARKGSAEEEDLEFLVRIGKRKSSMAYVTNSGIDVPSPVWEEHFDEEDIKFPSTSLRKASVVSAKAGRRVSIGGATLLREISTADEKVCTGCGSPPVASFVALVPCDHLVCHTCLNALINATAHKPPRPMACFACESLIKSFLPAWEGVGAANGGRIGLVEALQESLKNGKGRKAVVMTPVAGKKSRREGRGGGRRRSSTGATTTLESFQSQPERKYEVIEDKENIQFDLDIVEHKDGSRRASLTGSSSSPAGSLGRAGGAGHGAHLLSPLSLKSKKSQSVMASGSLSQVEYNSSSSTSPPAAESSTSPSRSRRGGRSPSNSLSTPGSTPNRRGSLSNSGSANARRQSRGSRYSTDATTPGDLSLAGNTSGLSPFKLVEAGGVETPGRSETGVKTREASEEWQVLDPMRLSNALKMMDMSPEPAEPVEWPVVRLDNIPWDVTVAEVEGWLPSESLAPVEKCVMAVHILCNRSDGRTLNQCYVEAASVAAARLIVRTRDGQKLGRRPVHVTLSSQGEFLTTLFPTYEPGFTGLLANRGAVPCPLLMQTELTGLLSLCKLESPHACKVKERPYYNIVSIIQKFPWNQPETWNSQQVVRLYNTSCAAVEILDVVRDEVADWHEILSVFTDAVVACPGFRPHQKNKLVKKTGLHHTRYPDMAPQKKHSTSHSFSFAPPSLREQFVTVGQTGLVDKGSTNPAALLSFAPSGGAGYDSDYTSSSSSPEPQGRHLQLPLAPSNRLSKTTSAPNLFSTSSSASVGRSPKKTTKHRVADIAKQLGVDDDLVKAVAEQLGLGVVSPMRL